MVRQSEVIFALTKLHVKSFEVFSNARITKYLIISISALIAGFSLIKKINQGVWKGKERWRRRNKGQLTVKALAIWKPTRK